MTPQDPRTYLFVPGNRPERFAKALASGADAIVLDLEDAVAPASKHDAREAVAQWCAGIDEAERARIVVRINDAHSSAIAEDLHPRHSARGRTVQRDPTTPASVQAAVSDQGSVAGGPPVEVCLAAIRVADDAAVVDEDAITRGPGVEDRRAANVATDCATVVGESALVRGGRAPRECRYAGGSAVFYGPVGNEGAVACARRVQELRDSAEYGTG